MKRKIPRINIEKKKLKRKISTFIIPWKSVREVSLIILWMIWIMGSIGYFSYYDSLLPNCPKGYIMEESTTIDKITYYKCDWKTDERTIKGNDIIEVSSETGEPIESKIVAGSPISTLQIIGLILTILSLICCVVIALIALNMF